MGEHSATQIIEDIGIVIHVNNKDRMGEVSHCITQDYDTHLIGFKPQLPEGKIFNNGVVFIVTRFF